MNTIRYAMPDGNPFELARRLGYVPFLMSQWERLHFWSLSFQEDRINGSVFNFCSWSNNLRVSQIFR